MLPSLSKDPYGHLNLNQFKLGSNIFSGFDFPKWSTSFRRSDDTKSGTSDLSGVPATYNAIHAVSNIVVGGDFSEGSGSSQRSGERMLVLARSSSNYQRRILLVRRALVWACRDG